MILLWLIAVLLVAGLLAWLAASWNTHAPRWIALVAAAADFVITLGLWVSHYGQLSLLPNKTWIEEVDWNWISSLGIHFHLALDGLSLLLLMLTFFLGIVSVLVSWREIRERVGFFHLNLLWVLAGITGVFLAIDLFLFYFAWELMLVPMYFLIALWGHERRQYASMKFFIFTQLSGLLMLIAILALYFAHHAATGVYTFEYEQLLGTPLSSTAAWWMMLGFFVAFAVKLPVIPVHTWLPDAHTEAPTAGSVVLAGLLLKTGAYGLLRFVVPLFPDAARQFAPIAMILAVLGILYGGLLAFGQSDFKRLVAYTSVSHLGFVLLGVFAWNELALQGALVTMIAHGISTGALFVIAGLLQDRMHTRDMDRMSGLWSTVPRLSGTALFFALGSLGLPGLGDFVGEFLVLLGTYRVSLALTALAAIGVLVATFYALRLVQRSFHGPNLREWKLPDIGARESLILVPMIIALLWLGLYPVPVLNTFKPAMSALQRNASKPVAIFQEAK
jgi:NADH-quinone oxidoreductase subunit M